MQCSSIFKDTACLGCDLRASRTTREAAHAHRRSREQFWGHALYGPRGRVINTASSCCLRGSEHVRCGPGTARLGAGTLVRSPRKPGPSIPGSGSPVPLSTVVAASGSALLCVWCEAGVATRREGLEASLCTPAQPLTPEPACGPLGARTEMKPPGVPVGGSQLP